MRRKILQWNFISEIANVSETHCWAFYYVQCWSIHFKSFMNWIVSNWADGLKNLGFIKLLWEYLCKGLWKWVILERTVKHNGPVKLHKLALGNISSFFAPTLVHGVLVLFGCTSSNRKGPQVTMIGPYIPIIGLWVEAFST